MGRRKFLNLQTIIPAYWCLGNLACLHQADRELIRVRPRRVVKLIKWDGVVNIYHQPINASELMLQFPKHLVCHSHSFYIGQKIPPLSPNDKLQLGHSYFLLPVHFFESVLSFVTIASSFNIKQLVSSSSPSSLKSGNKQAVAIANCQPFDIKKTPSGSLQIRVSDEFLSKLLEQRRQPAEGQEEEKDMTMTKNNIGSSSSSRGRICSTPELQRDYTQLVSSRSWKPKLDTIKESKRRKIYSSSFGIKRRKKSQQQITKAGTTTPVVPQLVKAHISEHRHQKSATSKIRIKAAGRKLKQYSFKLAL
ncbi:hypothetical protein IFM89_030432 [Coptis chinensis]|uniref:DUF4228 domain-containing protein n=1 Tax=Coptis chinensis TaxID=261450 RepID=A0A835LSZ1_9MAGN|nr:hypothetical protein IFM89_030432 [Coptis chinensis]